MKQFDVYIGDVARCDEDNPLVMIQFPAMKSQFDIDPDRIRLAIKEKSMKLKLDVDINTNSQFYCKNKAHIMAKLSRPQSFSFDKVDKNFYSSTKNSVDDKQLFVCKAINNSLVCHPISNFLTMRSDLSHFDLRDEIDPSEEVKPVSVKMSTDRPGAPSRRTQENKEESEEALEEFQPLRFKNMDSKEATAIKIALFGKKLKREPGSNAEEDEHEKESKASLLTDIKPKLEKRDIDDIYSVEAQNISTSSKRSNATKDLVKECLMKAKLVSFEEVYCYVEDQFRDQEGGDNLNSICTKDIINTLNEYAVLVQGNWAIKSEIFYGDSDTCECTDVTCIPITLFTAARDFLIWLFNQDRLVSRPEFSARVRIPDYDVMELFNQLATFRSDIKKWELKLPTDDKFLRKFPEVVQRQATFWKVRRANKLAIFD